MVGTVVFHQYMFPDFAFLRADKNFLRIHIFDYAFHIRNQGGPGVVRRFGFHSGPNQRRFGLEQGNRLPLHVRAHERPVGIVMLKEGNACGRNGNNLFRETSIRSIFSRETSIVSPR